MFISSIPLFLSIFSTVTSLFIAYRTIWLSRPNIKIFQTDNGFRSIFIESFDGCRISYSGSNIDKHPHITGKFYGISYLLIEVIITNQSSLPISILEFKTKDFIANPFTSYSDTLPNFLITTSKDGSIVLGDKNDPLKYLQPEFTIAPYTSERGYISFSSGTEQKFDTPSEIELEILTSRKTFITKISISASGYKSIKEYVKIKLDEDGNIQDSIYY